jgi:hypothetical protein
MHTLATLLMPLRTPAREMQDEESAKRMRKRKDGDDRGYIYPGGD